jgi:hypothetical protein
MAHVRPVRADPAARGRARVRGVGPGVARVVLSVGHKRDDSFVAVDAEAHHMASRSGQGRSGEDQPAGLSSRIASVVRLGSWIRPAGGSPVRVSAGAPGSRPQSRGEIPAAERGVESLFGGSKRVGWDCSLVRFTIGEPSRSFHGEGHVCQSWFRIGCGGSLRGRETCTRARSDHGTRETRLASLVSKDRSYKPMAKSSGGQRESEGVVVVMIGAQNNAPGAKGPCFDRGCGGGKR